MELTKIVQAVAQVDSPQEQVTLIVESISKSLAIDACSLYRVDDRFNSELLASHGLIATDLVQLPAGKGLVGLVARSRHPVNIADAASHPDFYHLDKSNEDNFKSYCGVPLVRAGKVIGVLAVQSIKSQRLSAESEAFLVTLASQLAMIVADVPRAALQQSTKSRRLPGVIGSPGIGVGKALLCAGSQLKNAPDAPCVNREHELAQWRDLLLSTQLEITEEKNTFDGELPQGISSIFDTYHMLLSDNLLISKDEDEIRAGHWLPGALRISINHFSELFKSMDDPYMSARHEDVQHLGNKLYVTWLGKEAEQGNRVPDDAAIVLVGTQVSISEIARIPTSQLVGIVCFEGSSLSHTSVLAHALGIPAVMGVNEPKDLQSGDLVIVDGNSGQVILNPSAMVAEEFSTLQQQDQLYRKQLDVLRDLPAITLDGERISLMANTGLLADISPGLKHGAEGIGLYRTEIPFMVRDSFPSEEEQIAVYRQVLAAYTDKPVYMRTLDIGGDKQLPYFPIHNEQNPALGWRGIRITLDMLQLLITQVRAMIRAAGDGNNLHILLPMVTSTAEIDTFNRMMDDVCVQLTEEGIIFYRPKVGVMIEVPAAISQLPFWKDKIDFVSIGSNDLSQYLLAVDRNNARVASLYDHVHPAMLREIQRIVTTAKNCNIPLSLCGEMGSDPIAVVLLIGMGVKQLSMSAAMLPTIKSLIRKLEFSRAQMLLEKTLLLDSVSSIRTLVTEELQRIGFNR